MLKINNIKSFIRKFSPNFIDSTQILLGRKDKSYAQEFNTLYTILKTISGISNKKFIDIGCGDGFNMSTAFPLTNHGWIGLLIDSDLKSIEIAKKRFKNSNHKIILHNVTSLNIFELILINNYADASYLKIDIDSYDLTILKSVLNAGMRPDIFSIEINERFPPPIKFERFESVERRIFPDFFYGCSLSSVEAEARNFNYVLIDLAYNNAFYVRKELIPNNFKLKDIYTIYNEGYAYRASREKLFYWNKKYDHWIKQSPARTIEEIEKSFPELRKFGSLSFSSRGDRI